MVPPNSRTSAGTVDASQHSGVDAAAARSAESLASNVLIPPRLVGALTRYELTAPRRDGSLGGSHRSPRHGSSQDFADYREYRPGDDHRRIDQRVLARLDQVLIRLHDAEESARVRLIVDNSASMGFDDKAFRAAQVAGVVGQVALQTRDLVEVVAAPGAVRHEAIGGGRAGIPALHRRLLATARTSSPDGSVAETVSLLQRGGNKTAITVLFSDLAEPTWELALEGLLGAKQQNVLVHVVAPFELDPTKYPHPELGEILTGDVTLVDIETRSTVEVSATSKVLKQYRDTFVAWCDTVAQACARRGIRYVRVRTDEDLEQLALGPLRAAAGYR